MYTTFEIQGIIRSCNTWDEFNRVCEIVDDLSNDFCFECQLIIAGTMVLKRNELDNILF